MKWLVLLIAGLLCCTVEAAPGLLVPMVTPLPAFPEPLLANRHAGKVRALLSVRSDGAVVEARAIESSHPEFTEAVEHALLRWRFKPWIGTVGAPPQIIVTLPVIFGSHGLARFDSQVSAGLASTPCTYLNYEINAHQKSFPKAPLSKIDLFWYTGQFLHGSYAALQSGEAERKALLRELEQAIPGIIAGCRNNPQSRYGDYLPAQIRAMVVDVAEPQGAM